MKKLRTLSAIVLSVAALALLVTFCAPVRLMALVALGRSPVCPLGNALSSVSNREEERLAKDRILLASRLVKEESGLELWDTPRGEFWIPKGNRYVLPFNLAEMERRIYGSGEHFIQKGDIVLDCGASDGDFTREALAAGASKVISIEVSPSSAECIRRNLADEIAKGRVVVYPKGVWDKDDRMMLQVDDTNFAANSVALHPAAGHPSVEVPLTTIDHIVAEFGLPKVDFIKMDIEGAEIPALHGAQDTLTRFKPRLAIATEHKEDDQVMIPRTVRGIRGDYRMECGPCVEERRRVRPDVLYFY